MHCYPRTVIYPYYDDYVIADTVFELPVLAMQGGMQAAL